MTEQLPFSIENFKGGARKSRSKTPKRKVAKRSPAKRSPAKRSPAKRSPAKKGRSARKGKGGADFLGVVSELLFPTGFEHAATTAGLVGLDAWSKKRSASKAKKGGAKKSKSPKKVAKKSKSPKKVAKKSKSPKKVAKKSKSPKKTMKKSKSPKKVTKKSKSPKKAKKSKSPKKGKKGGDFLTAAASIVAPTGFETLATAAGLTGLARATSGRKLRNKSARKDRR
jgi:hypothetical protein